MKNVASNYYMMKKIHQKSSLHQLTKNKMRFGHVSRALKSVVLGLDKVYMMTHAPAVVKSPNGGTSQSWIGEINSQTAIRTRTRTRW